MPATFSCLLQRLRGGRSPWHVAPTIVLGALIGAACGWNFTFAALLTAAALFNGPPALLVPAICAGWVLSLAHGVTRAIGYFMLEKLGLGGIVETLGQGTATALLRWDDYQLVGGATLAFAASLPWAHFMARRAARENETPPAAPLLRPHGWVGAAACWIILAMLVPATAPGLIGEAILTRLSAAAGAPVTAESVSYDLWNGDLELTNIRLGDPDEKGRVALRIERATTRVHPGLLLRERLHCDDLALSGITCDPPTARREPVKLFSGGPVMLRESGVSPSREGDAGKPVDVRNLVRDWSGVEQRLVVLQRLIAAVEGVADLEEPHSASAARLAAAARPSAAPRDGFSGRVAPLVEIGKLRFAGLPTAWRLSRSGTMELAHLTSRPATSLHQVQLTLDDATCGFHLGMNFRLTTADRRHDVAATWTNGSAVGALDVRRLSDAGIEASQTKLTSVRGRGWATRDMVELPLTVEVRGVNLAEKGDRFGGLDFAVWRQSLSRLGGLRFESSLAGAWTDPRLRVVPTAVVDQLKYQLRAAGEHPLVAAVEAGHFPKEPPTQVAAAPAVAPVAAAATAAVAASPAVVPPSAPIGKPVEVVTPTAATAPADASPPAPQPPAAPLAPPVVMLPESLAPTVVLPSVPKNVAALTPPSAVSALPPKVELPAPLQEPPSTTTLAPPTVSPVAPPVAPPAVIAAPSRESSRPIVSAAVRELTTEALPPSPTVQTPPVSDVQQAALLATLRQPKSVADPSAAPGPITGAPGYDGDHRLPPLAYEPTPPQTKPWEPTATPPIAAAVRPEAPSLKPSATPTPPLTTPNGPIAGAPPAKKRRLFAGLTDWIAGTEEDCEMLPPQTEIVIPQPQDTASKPMFPRLRGMFANEPETIDVHPPQAAVPQSSVPQTAREPWYDRIFR